jgi:hypothetical protein
VTLVAILENSGLELIETSYEYADLLSLMYLQTGSLPSFIFNDEIGEVVLLAGT